ncbi:MAG: hypothetical protein E5V48_01050 [Mesorhizobium sp.]|nr:hypothetical protein EN848_30950 [bacterium M00.F.Ca.ET.205.01.1.1]TGU46692.1 hypothetical protein EN795_31345 [bacterium M00.F.Ca.ET.152.01.1.1]TIW63100.1 MAG: hypothetical protein E5V48_01050 [Mesorhizobium sp.]
MPRFFFDSHDGTILIRDSDGLEFATAQEAKQALQDFLVSVLQNSRRKDEERSVVWVLLRDETGKPLTQAITEIRDISN